MTKGQGHCDHIFIRCTAPWYNASTYKICRHPHDLRGEGFLHGQGSISRRRERESGRKIRDHSNVSLQWRGDIRNCSYNINVWIITISLSRCLRDNKVLQTFASNVCLNISQSVLANLSDFPVSVAYKIVHFTRFDKAFTINLALNFTALKKTNIKSLTVFYTMFIVLIFVYIEKSFFSLITSLFGGIRVAHLFSFLYCSIICLYVLKPDVRKW